jgi:TRAP-type C4-dicarboxylate transport system substrate-binding protein
MNFLNKITSVAVAMILIVGFSASVQAEEWKGWNIHVAGYPNTVALDKFAELLNQKSGGKMKVKMYHAGTLGSQPDAIEQVRMGGLEKPMWFLFPLSLKTRITLSVFLKEKREK